MTQSAHLQHQLDGDLKRLNALIGALDDLAADSQALLERDILAKGYFYRTVVSFDDRLWSPSAVPDVAFSNGFGNVQDHGTALKGGGLLEGSWKVRLFGDKIENVLIAGFDGFVAGLFWNAVTKLDGPDTLHDVII